MAEAPGHTEERSDEDLMAAYVAGDQAAFEALFCRYAPVVMRLMRRQVRREADATDLVQQTFLQLHRARRDFRTDAKLRPWLMTIALNLRREYFRKLGRRKETELEPLIERNSPVLPSIGPEGMDDFQLQERVRAAVALLPDGQREVILLHWFQGKPFGEIAELVGASVSAVKVRAHRGYKALRQQLGSFEAE